MRRHNTRSHPRPGFGVAIICHCGSPKSLQCLVNFPSPFRFDWPENSMHSVFETAPAAPAIPIIFASKATWDAICADLPGEARQFALANGFAAKPGACLTLPAADGKIVQVLFGLEDETGKFRDLFRPGSLPDLLPPGVY